MDYEEAMKYITDTYKFGSKMGLERIKRLLGLLGDPQKEMKFVHIAGTNGKGSTTSFISAILMEAGYKTGMFVSPFIQRFNERIRINNVEIDGESIAAYIREIKEKIGIMSAEESPHPTEFEIITAMAFMHYKKNKCDIVVLETGLGGIIDSTNVIETSEVSVITTIDFDHQQYLGNTIEEIAEKKAGIIKENGSVVLYPQMENVTAVFEKECRLKNAKLYKVLREDVQLINFSTEYQEFNFLNHKNLKIQLLGKHQIMNASVSVRAIDTLIEKGYNITEENIRNGLREAKWAGRFEIVNKNPMVIIDGAHNVEGARNLAANLLAYFPEKKITFIAGVLKDKNFEQMLDEVIPIADKFLTVAPDYYRAVSAEELKTHLLKRHSNVTAFKSIKDALHFALAHAGAEEIICAFGSLYYIGEIRGYFGLYS